MTSNDILHNRSRKKIKQALPAIANFGMGGCEVHNFNITTLLYFNAIQSVKLKAIDEVD